MSMVPRSSLAKALIFAAVFSFLGCGKKAVQTEAAPPPEVLVTQVVKADVPVVREWVGTLSGSVNADIRARVNGYLQKKDYDEGSFIKEGDLMFEIDPRPFEAALARANCLRSRPSSWRRRLTLSDPKTFLTRRSSQCRNSKIRSN